MYAEDPEPDPRMPNSLVVEMPEADFSVGTSMSGGALDPRNCVVARMTVSSD
jgi:hypothetical protein